MIEQAIELAECIKQDHLTCFDAEIVFQERWMATTKYYLPITRFDNYHHHQITNVEEQVILPKLGFNRHMHKMVLYEPKIYGGKQLMNMHT